MVMKSKTKYKKDKSEKEKISKMVKDGEVVVKITSTEIYSFKKGSINGWDADAVTKDWFDNRNLHMDHATRDAHLHFGTKKLLKVEVFESNYDVMKKYDDPKKIRVDPKKFKDITSFKGD